MHQRIGLVVILLGLSGIFGCAQTPDKSDTVVAPAPESTVIYAHAAVEVGKIDIAQMPEFQASVERMNLDERAQLWGTLQELHDSVHPSEPAEHDGAAKSGPSGAEAFGCSTAHCSHSDPNSQTAQWCCAFGEDALFYQDDPIATVN
jgi:hypothetical protein